VVFHGISNLEGATHALHRLRNQAPVSLTFRGRKKPIGPHV
jgi:hypothetical protein